MLKKSLRNQKGFTLIEIIAVLVILGILAAVAVPKYMDLQNDAKTKSIETALAAGGGNAFSVFAKALLSGTTPNMSSVTSTLNTDAYTHVGDFLVSYTNAGTLTGCTAGNVMTVTFAGGPPNGTTAPATYLTGSGSMTKLVCLQ